MSGQGNYTLSSYHRNSYLYTKPSCLSYASKSLHLRLSFQHPPPTFSNLSSGVGFLDPHPVVTVSTPSLSCGLVLNLSFSSGVIPLPIFQLLLSSITVLPSLFTLVFCEKFSFYTCKASNLTHLCLSGSHLRLILYDCHSLNILRIFYYSRTTFTNSSCATPFKLGILYYNLLNFFNEFYCA